MSRSPEPSKVAGVYSRHRLVEERPVIGHQTYSSISSCQVEKTQTRGEGWPRLVLHTMKTCQNENCGRGVVRTHLHLCELESTVNFMSTR